MSPSRNGKPRPTPYRRRSDNLRSASDVTAGVLSNSSQRPRDRLGRPLDPGDPRSFPQIPQRAEISAQQAWNEALGYLDQELPFHAHEVFEQRWKSCPHIERDAWQALAQWGAALTQQARENFIGQRRLAERARDRLLSAQSKNAIPDVVDAQYVLESLAQLT
jgi:hypothetical protein